MSNFYEARRQAQVFCQDNAIESRKLSEAIGDLIERLLDGQYEAFDDERLERERAEEDAEYWESRYDELDAQHRDLEDDYARVSVELSAARAELAALRGQP